MIRYELFYGERYLRRAGFFAVYRRYALTDTDRSFYLDYLYLKTERIARNYLSAELCFLNAAEKADLALVLGEHQHRHGARLRQHLKDKYARDNGVIGEMTLEPEVIRLDML